jgi:hypothetical protein
LLEDVEAAVGGIGVPLIVGTASGALFGALDGAPGPEGGLPLAGGPASGGLSRRPCMPLPATYLID